jgi:peptidoglycan/LPS O-acetylase OafA/YrhL
MVIIHHIEQFKDIFELNNMWDVPFFQVIGKLGVVLFFVLSGFLISYLLLVEKERTDTINVRMFYMRRVLRIWPLYYLIVILSLFVLPYISMFNLPNVNIESIVKGDWLTLIFLFVFILPNMALVKFGAIPFSAPTWSIGVEEQFYFIWPNLLKKFNRPPIVFAMVIIVYLFVKILLDYFSGYSGYLYLLKGFWGTFLIDLMAIGAIGAYLVKVKSKWLALVYNKYVQFSVYLLTIILILNGVRFPYLHYEVYAFLFIVIILNLATNKNSIISLENKVFNYLGKISYGLYLFHGPVIAFTLNLCLMLEIENQWIISIFSIGLTIAIAGLSFTYFESYFMKYKHKYSIVKSGEK